MLDMISMFLHFLRFDLWPNMCSILENVPCALEKKVYTSTFGWNVLKISMRSISSNVSFKTYKFSVLIICPLVWVGCLSLLLLFCYFQFLLLCLLVFVLRFEMPLCWVHAAAAAKSLQLCPTLCNPRDGSPPGSPVPGTLQARTLEWVAISFSNVWKWKVKMKSLSRVWLLATPWTAAHQAPPSMGFSKQEYWSGVPLPYVFLLDWSLDHYVVSFLISCNLLYFKVYFVCYDDCYFSFLLLPICMEYIFPSSHFQSICVFRSEVYFL